MCATGSAFNSYPTTEREKVDFNGEKWQGQFAGVDGKKSIQWVKDHAIVAVHSRDFDKFKGKDLILKDPASGKTISATVLDMCSDDDCSGCCSENAKKYGCDFLIDVEHYTLQKWMPGTDSENFFQKILWKPAEGSSEAAPEASPSSPAHDPAPAFVVAPEPAAGAQADWKCVKSDNKKAGKVKIWWGYTPGDAGWACNTWIPECESGCTATPA